MKPERSWEGIVLWVIEAQSQIPQGPVAICPRPIRASDWLNQGDQSGFFPLFRYRQTVMIAGLKSP